MGLQDESGSAELGKKQEKEKKKLDLNILLV
jgi:hypothetical protein